LKVSIGSKIVDGPWGGGNLFVKNLSKYLINLGHDVIYDLSEKDIDLILLTDPRSRKESSSTFNHKDITNYKKYINPKVKVVQRINECDERKGTNFINKFYLEASSCADHIVFVSTWLRDIYLDLGMDIKKTSVILAGANSDIFNSLNSAYWEKNQKIRLVTHHWSNHINKGFLDYKFIDELLENHNWKNKLKFTYIGNLNKEFDFKNIKTMPPLDGAELSREIKNHHIYITASINEPSGNHHIEAAQCGLPILYKQSGGIPEYCEDFGISFNDDLEEKLKLIIENYDDLKHKMEKYSLNSAKMSNQFLELFQKLLNQQSPNKKVVKNMDILFAKYFFLKNNTLKIFRDKYYLNLKLRGINIIKKAILWIRNS
jgi:glycosyltransferase involved in cell wall biosynthesis